MSELISVISCLPSLLTSDDCNLVSLSTSDSGSLRMRSNEVILRLRDSRIMDYLPAGVLRNNLCPSHCGHIHKHKSQTHHDKLPLLGRATELMLSTMVPYISTMFFRSWHYTFSPFGSSATNVSVDYSAEPWRSPLQYAPGFRSCSAGSSPVA